MSTSQSFGILQQALCGPKRNGIPLALAGAWPSIRSWWATPVKGLAPGEDLLGFEASVAEERTFLLTMFRLAEATSASEHGIEAAYEFDGDWLRVLRDWPEWDWNHPIGFHVWGAGHADSGRFADSIERLAIFKLALEKPCLHLRLFSPDGEDHIVPPVARTDT